MTKQDRLTKNWQYSAVYARGRTWVGDLVVLKALPNGLDVSRYGLVAGKRVGGAVERNRVKRRLREIIRAAPVELGWDVVLIARSQAVDVDYRQLEGAVARLLKRARLLPGRVGMGRESEKGVDGSGK